MRALTICQPYAHLVMVERKKRVENRSWPTNYRGPLAIHAGKSRSWLDLDFDDAGCEIDAEYSIHVDSMAFGAVLGVVDLVDCIHIDHIQSKAVAARYPWLQDHEHAEGPWCWILENVRPLQTPVPWKGAQGLWHWPRAPE